ncbi:hypothetical protein T484DRAFT_1773569 [Baffinella frigidus]|nr:hypothetical protein T484DRAFT_1773569 [Cryptophyta sp. CCMP2293]
MRLTAAVAVLLASMAPCAVEGFAAPASAAALRHNGFTGCTVAAPLVQGKSSRSAGPMMMGKQAAAGPFTPAVVVLRGAVGEKKFNQIRGKGITLHSQVISEFCFYAGVPKQMRQGLIRQAKNNGNTLGFLS